MSLEAIMILIDNSSYSINGDYLPTRLQSQISTASVLIESKLSNNPQSAVGIGLLGGDQPKILCTLTTDSMKASSTLFGLKCHGSFRFSQGLQIAALALKHRSNESQKQRIVCFVGTAIEQDVQTLKIIVAIDLITFGHSSQAQKTKIDAFMQVVKQQSLCHAINIPPGPYDLLEKLYESEIMGGRGTGNMGNVDQEDLEMAAALRASLAQSQQQGANNNQHTEEQLQALAIRMSLEESDYKPPEKKEE